MRDSLVGYSYFLYDYYCMINQLNTLHSLVEFLHLFHDFRFEMVVQLPNRLVLSAIGLQTSHQTLQSHALLISLLDLLPATLQLYTKLMLLGSAPTQLLLHLSHSLPSSFEFFPLSFKVVGLVVLYHFIEFLLFLFECLFFLLKLLLHLLCIFFIGLELKLDFLDGLFH